VIYYQKIKFLIESGLQFDELMVFSDLSDVPDEATSYFCIDDDPEYRKYCHDTAPRYAGLRRTVLQRNFWVIDSTYRLIKTKISVWKQSKDSGEVLIRLSKSPLALWTVSNDFGTQLDPPACFAARAIRSQLHCRPPQGKMLAMAKARRMDT
jgi:hypothetical protein